MKDERQVLEQMMIRPEVQNLMQQTAKKHPEVLPPDNRTIKMLVLKEHIINSIFWNTLIDMMEIEIKRMGFAFQLCIVDEEEPALSRNDADAYLLLGNLPERYTREVLESRKPLVWVDSESRSRNYNQVRANNHYGTYQMAKYAIELGHRRLAFINSPAHLSYLERCQGMLDCAADYAAQGVTCETIECTGKREQELILELLTRKNAPTFIQTVCDSLALEVYKVAEQLMLNIPGDLSVAGFDNMKESRMLLPPLCSVDVPRVDMAIAAVELLVKHMNTPLSAHELIQLEPALVIRGSLAAPPAPPAP